MVCKTCNHSFNRKPCNDSQHIRLYTSTIRLTLLKQHKYRIKAIELLGGKCVKCGNQDIRVLQINHKNGGGTKEFHKVNSSPRKVYQGIIKDAPIRKNYDVRCANCNILYEYEVGRRH
jgi:predicted nucleic-acid-binding Zn-ribbon protein